MEMLPIAGEPNISNYINDDNVIWLSIKLYAIIDKTIGIYFKYCWHCVIKSLRVFDEFVTIMRLEVDIRF